LAGTSQPLLITVATRPTTVPGTYTAPVTVSAANQGPQTVTLTVVVRDVSLPRESHTVSLWGTQISEWDLAFGHISNTAPSVPVCNDSAREGAAPCT